MERISRAGTAGGKGVESASESGSNFVNIYLLNYYYIVCSLVPPYYEPEST